MLANIEALASGETDGTCEASVGCSDKPNDYVRCSGKNALVAIVVLHAMV